MKQQYSFSRVESFNHCKYKYKLSYVDKLDVIDVGDTAANALVIGTAMHKGIEEGLESALAYYRKSRFSITDLSLDEEFKLSKLVPKARAALPSGELEFEHPLNSDNFQGFVDLVVKKENGHIALYDFKYSNNKEKYINSAQIHVYKYFYQLENPEAVIDELGYFFIPKTSIRQKKTESLMDFKARLIEEVNKLEIDIVNVDYDPNKVFEFLQDTIKVIDHELNVKEYPKQEDSLCFFCKFNDFCKKQSELLMLPKNEKRAVNASDKIKICVYGRPYAGKTYFANTFPSPIFLNTDGNINSFDAPYIALVDTVEKETTPTGRTKTVESTGWSKFLSAVDELCNTEHDFKTVVVDRVDDLFELCRRHQCTLLGIKHESEDSFRSYDIVRNAFFEPLKRLASSNLNVVFIAHEECSRDLTKPSGEKITYIGPAITEKVANKLAGLVDITARIIFDNKNHNLVLDSDVFGGNRLGIPSASINATYTSLVALYEKSTANTEQPKQEQAPVPAPAPTSTEQNTGAPRTRRTRRSHTTPDVTTPLVDVPVEEVKDEEDAIPF